MPEVLPGNGLPPGRHLVEHGAQREQIRPRVERLAAHLLGRHVRRPCPAIGRRAGQLRFGRSLTRRRAASPGGLASPKSSSFAWPRSVTKMLAGLMSRWTMPFACAAASASAICDAHVEHFVYGRAACRR